MAGPPAYLDDRPLLLFDGMCVLCSGGAQFVLKHDRRRRFRLAASQSRLGEALYRHHGLDPDETIILIDQGRVLTRSDAAIAVATGLGAPWSFAAALRILPRAWRDAAYRFIARRRLRWFGRRDRCLVPDPADADRFLE